MQAACRLHSIVFRRDASVLSRNNTIVCCFTPRMNMRVRGVKYNRTLSVDQSDAEFIIICISLNQNALLAHSQRGPRAKLFIGSDYFHATTPSHYIG